MKKVIPILLVATIIGSLASVYYTTIISGREAMMESALFGFRRLISPNESIYGIIALLSLSTFPFIKSRVLKLINFFAILFSLLALIITLTRGTWIAFTVGFIFVAIQLGYKYGHKVIWKIIPIPTLVLLLLLVYMVMSGRINIVLRIVGRLSTLFTLQFDVSALTRLNEWKQAFDLFAKYPIIGTGLGYEYTVYYLNFGYRTVPYIHNSYLYFLTKMGIVGLFSFCGMIVSFIYHGLKKVSAENDHLLSGFIYGVIGSLILLIVKCFTTYHFNTDSVTVFIGFLLGILLFYIKNEH